LKIETTPGAGLESNVLHAAAASVDPRFNFVRLDLRGPAFRGSLEAFIRPAPVAQPSMTEIGSLVRRGEFADQNALIIGGSRGLGETTAKILAAGGASVCVTYSTGSADALRVCTEIREAGGHCEAAHIDIAEGADLQSVALASSVAALNHVYFFASPHIAKNTTNTWNAKLYQTFHRVYVDGFMSVIDAVIGAGARPGSLTVYFPSTAFLDRQEKGFAEYAAAKAAGESTCDYLRQHRGIKCLAPRLPRMRTDQTSGLAESDATSPLGVMLASMRSLAEPA
jgi:NAD(P)-dependent dehydrogenase (short-subunit alcohol dehydrogenase family)